MKFNRNLTTALVLAVLGTTAFAQADKTRDQVKAELAEAIRTGDIAVRGLSELKLNELHPGRYPAKPVAIVEPREKVKAELAEAIRTGDIVVGESALKLNELQPGRYPAKPTVIGKTRDQVKAETAEAVRTGDISYGEASLKLNEQFPQRHAKLRKESGDEVARSAGADKSNNLIR